MRIVYIYGLIDPRTNRIRYVGKSKHPEFRLRQHIEESRKGANNHKSAWIRGLLNKKLSPFVQILEKVREDNWEEAEIYWIGKLREQGENLVNMCDGGNGSGGRTLTVIHKERISKALTGIKRGSLSEELKKKLSAIHKGRKKKPLTTETKQKLREINLGRKLSQETKRKISKSLTGKKHPFTEEGRRKVIEANKSRGNRTIKGVMDDLF